MVYRLELNGIPYTIGLNEATPYSLWGLDGAPRFINFKIRIGVAYFTIRLFFMDLTPLTLRVISIALSTAF
jgi:hypothetical protein